MKTKWIHADLKRGTLATPAVVGRKVAVAAVDACGDHVLILVSPVDAVRLASLLLERAMTLIDRALIDRAGEDGDAVGV